MRSVKKQALFTIALFLLFLVFTVLVKTVDVRVLGETATDVGFGALNAATLCPYHESFYEISQYLGYFALLLCGVFALCGLYQWIRKGSIKKVDYRILLLGGFYLLVLALYFGFDKLALNYRPVIVDAAEGLEASYPSSHTMLALCVFGTAMLFCRVAFPNKRALRAASIVALGALMILTVATRYLSGVHWLTDILASILLSAALVSLYSTCVSYVGARRTRRN